MNEPIYFTDEHRQFRDNLRRFIAQEIVPKADAWEEAGMVPREVLRQLRVQTFEAFSLGVLQAAEGEAARFSQLVEAYEKAPRVTRERLYIDAVENVMTRSRKVIVDTKGGNGQMLTSDGECVARAFVIARNVQLEAAHHFITM